MRIKKLVAALLATAMVVTSLAGCGSKGASAGGEVEIKWMLQERENYYWKYQQDETGL